MDLQNELLESGKQHQKGGWKATLASLGVHGAIIGLILFISTQATQKVAAEDKPIHAYLSSKAAPPPPPPPPPPPAASHASSTPKVVKPVQVTHHKDGSLFFPSISSDGKVIVYEENFGLWKLDTATGRTSEVKIDITSDDKENEYSLLTIHNEADSYDLSPSTKRAAIPAHVEIFTIATDRGDVSRVTPSPWRETGPKWSPDGKSIPFVRYQIGRAVVWLTH